MKKYMVDSNIIIEYMKDNLKAVGVINFIKTNPNNEYYITLDTLEEILYVLLKHFSKKSYWNLKNNPDFTKEIYKKIAYLLEPIITSLFKFVSYTDKTYELLFYVCKNYGLLPKDALLIALCIENNIDNLITLDEDFKKVNLKEDIKIVNKI
ncbi:MAG: hypothetical protein DSY60_01445 [Persephonella sp.]|nr:MAG: hypothetical protein DSY60_01445 [Persephonella sp.]